MPKFSLTVETTSNSNTGGLFQFLMPSARHAKLIGCLLQLPAEESKKDIGRFVIDRISAIGSTNWDSLTPFELDPGGRASEVTDATKTIEATCNGSGATLVDTAMFELLPGWNDLEKFNIMSGSNQGFQVRRATAPAGARVVSAMLIWEE